MRENPEPIKAIPVLGKARYFRNATLAINWLKGHDLEKLALGSILKKDTQRNAFDRGFLWRQEADGNLTLLGIVTLTGDPLTSVTSV